MRHAITCLAALLPLLATAAPPSLTVSPPTPQPGDVVTVGGKSALTWEVRGAGETLVHPRKTSVTFVMPDVGSIVVLAAGNSSPALNDVAVVVVGQGGNPQPGPQPVDALAVKVSALFAADVSATKADDAAKLAAVYRQLVKSAVDDAGVTTAAKLLAISSDAARQVVPLPKLKTVREAFADELDAKLGRTPSAPLTPELRTTARDQFTRIATILETLK